MKATKRPGTTRRSSTAAPVLLVASGNSRPLVALKRASVFAAKLGAPLVVVGWRAPRRGAGVFFPHARSANMVARMSDTATGLKRLWRWCNQNLATGLPPDAVHWADATMVAAAVGAARALSAQLVVLPEHDLLRADEVTAIVEDSGVSVLVSRPRQASNAVVAASDLQLEQTPVLREGALAGEILQATVKAFHNVDQEWVGAAVIGPTGETMMPLPAKDRATRFRRKRRLDEAAARIGGVHQTKVVGHVDTATAILEFARENEADLVVVGHRKHGWLDRVFSPGVSTAVVGKARRSVLVVPVPR